MRKYKVPFNQTEVVGNELEYIRRAIINGHISGNGFFTKKCEKFLEKKLQIKRVLLTMSGTHALEMSALLLDIKKGDEVIVPSFTFVSTINAFVLRGAKPVFCDIRKKTLNLNEELLPKLITKKTKAIVPVHYASVACQMDKLINIAKKTHIPIVEDTAHGLFSKYKNKYLGTFGCLSIFSFHETKNIICGEGGALAINDPQYIERAEIIQEKGTNRNNFFKGKIDKYTWCDIGSSYSPSDILAAYLWAQLEKRKYIMSKRRKIWSTYYNRLKNWASEHDIQLPYVPSDCKQSFHMFYMIMPNKKIRDDFIKYMKGKGINCVFHYVPLHQSKMAGITGAKSVKCSVTEDVSSCLVRLPFFSALTESQQNYVVKSIKNFG